MINHEAFVQRLVEELKQYPVFSKYWSAELTQHLPRELTLVRVPGEYISIYRCELAVDLKPAQDLPGLAATRARLKLVVASTTPTVEYEKLLDPDGMPSDGERQAVCAIATIFGASGCQLAEYQKTLWSSAEPSVTGDPKYC